MLRLRTSSLAVAAAAVLASCTSSQGTPAVAGRATGAAPAPSGAVVLGTFQGTIDPATGKLTIGPVQPVSPTAVPNALSVFDPTQDGTPGSGAPDTFELVTEMVSTTAPGAVIDGCAPGVDSFEGAITLRSFYTTQTFWNVYVELTNVVPDSSHACNSDPNFADLTGAFGLWKYGTIGPAGGRPGAPDHATVRWKFLNPSVAFTFTGHIMAMGGPEFDWTPAAMTAPTRKFQDVTQSTAHFRWDGSQLVDLLGVGMTFGPTGTVGDASIGLTSTRDHYATFSAGYLTTTAGGGVLLDTSRDFTVCAKVKPGAHPGTGPSKVFVARGKPATSAAGDGWVLMQDGYNYVFQYQLNGGGVYTAYIAPGYDGATNNATVPEAWAYDYVCGGRDGANIIVGAHGKWRGTPVSLGSTNPLTLDAGLPISIGAYPDGSGGAADAGVYEVILDSRVPSDANLDEIVTAAEARSLPNAVNLSDTFLPWNASTTEVVGADSNTYFLPPFATPPLASDGLGPIVPAAFQLEYTYPVIEDTTVTGYCVGAEVKANGAWATTANRIPAAGVLQFGTAAVYGALAVSSGDKADNVGFWFFLSGNSQAYGSVPGTGWTSGSAHQFLACVDPAASATVPKVYVDGTLATATANTGSAPFNVGALGQTIGIGNPVHGGAFVFGGTPLPLLTNARITHVVFCPSNDPLLCQY